MSATIRSADINDLPNILSLLAEMHDERRDEEPRQDEIARFRRILEQPLRTLFVAEEDGKVVGTADLIVVENLSRNGRPWATIENIVVEAGHRNRGYATALINQAVDTARELGCYKVQLVSNDRRVVAHNLYHKTGFCAPVRGFRQYLCD